MAVARVRRWGNSLAVRLRKEDVERRGITEGDFIRFDVVKVVRPRGLSLQDLPTFKDEDPRASVNHDRYLYG